MSAAVRLQMLANVIAPFSYIGAASPGQAKADVLNALPEIIAVVKAAEILPEFFHDDSGQIHSFIPLLDALDVKLSQ